LVSNNSELFSELPGQLLFGRSSSKNAPEFIATNPSNLFQNFSDPDKDKEKEAKPKF
jgi:hypothetical protein